MTDRYLDLLKQGFMKPSKPAKQKKAPPIMVSCEGCNNWHYENKHTEAAAVRKANIKEWDKFRSNTQRG
jgi:hypothetical protein